MFFYTLKHVHIPASASDGERVRQGMFFLNADRVTTHRCITLRTANCSIYAAGNSVVRERRYSRVADDELKTPC